MLYSHALLLLQADLVRMRDTMSRISNKGAPPLLRGWTGARFPGQSIGQPDAVADC